MGKYESQEILKWSKGEVESIEDEIVVESSLNIIVNDRDVVTLLSSPAERKELALGFMKSEGLIEDLKQVKRMELGDSKKNVEIKLDESVKIESYFERKRALTSSCGSTTSVVENLDRLELTSFGPDMESPAVLTDLMGDMQKQAELFRLTGGSHTAAIASEEKVLHLVEDIGRHNAVDKVIGKSLFAGEDLEEKVLLTSGRLSSEMTLKAIRSRIPITVSRSAPTTLAVRIARAANLSMVGFTRGKRMNIYAGEERLLG